MRKKLPENEKKKSIGISFEPRLLEAITEYTEKNNLKVSRFIEGVIKEHFEKKNNNEKNE